VWRSALAAGLFLAAAFPPLALATHEPFIQPTPGMMKIVCVELGQGDHRLRTKYQEAPVMRGYTEDGAAFQLYRNEDGSTWTITLLVPGNNAECIVMSGENLKTVPWILDGKSY